MTFTSDRDICLTEVFEIMTNDLWSKQLLHSVTKSETDSLEVVKANFS